MGKLNMKLMKGVEETENQIQTQKQDTMFVDSQKPQNPQRQSEPRKNIQKRKKSENKPNMNPQKQVFSFRAVVSDISIWRAYVTASGKTMENIATAAMNEYMKRHKLNDAERAVFEALKAREGKRG